MLDGKIWLTEVGHATHYHAYWVHPSWVHEMKKMYRLGVHTFYRPRAWGDVPEGADLGRVPFRRSPQAVRENPDTRASRSRRKSPAGRAPRARQAAASPKPACRQARSTRASCAGFACLARRLPCAHLRTRKIQFGSSLRRRLFCCFAICPGTVMSEFCRAPRVRRTPREGADVCAIGRDMANACRRHRLRLSDRGARLRPALGARLLSHAAVEREPLGPRRIRFRAGAAESAVGRAQPFAGAIADRFGAPRVLCAGACSMRSAWC